MKLRITILLFLSFSVIHCKTGSSVSPNKYIDIVYYKNNDKALSHISTSIKEVEDSIGIFINNHRPRFAYFFGNNIDKDTLEKLYPDTLLIEQCLYEQVYAKPFLSNFSKLAMLDNNINESYSFDEIMKVASRFFVVVRKKDGLRLKICGGGNDFTDLNAIKDMSLVEAMTYEAIMRGFKMDKRPQYISSARICFSNSIKNPEGLSSRELIIRARNKVYKTMEMDNSLRDYLTDYFMDNTTNLPFEIQVDE